MAKYKILKQNKKAGKRLIARRFDFCVELRGRVVFESRFLKLASNYYDVGTGD